TRSRKPRFLNRRRRAGWLPPSLQHRVDTTLTWVNRLRRFLPITAISTELVRFDLQQLEQPDSSGVAYQQGTLAGYEVREYLLERWNRRCTYCGATGVPLQVEHIVPKARGGSDRISNLTLACEPCNTRKGRQTAAEFGYPQIQAQARQPLRDAAAMNATRWALYQRLGATGLPMEVGSGGRTKFNRTRLGLPKAHWTDAACVGYGTPDALDVRGVRPLAIRATGHGSRQMCRMDRFGFPRTGPKQARRVRGFQTGDLVRAVVPSGRFAGVSVGRIAIRSRPSFRFNGRFDVHPNYLTRIHRADGYTYAASGASPAA
ncbi:MAG: HNH endonuclease, partial [Oscillochloris sp.]|nr:HNH endonuclease [Oscillochloris sp.]